MKRKRSDKRTNAKCPSVLRLKTTYIKKIKDLSGQIIPLISTEVASSPDLEVLETLAIHFVKKEVWQLFSQLVKAEEEALHIAELQFGLLACRVLSIFYLFWWKGHKFLKVKTPKTLNS